MAPCPAENPTSVRRPIRAARPVRRGSFARDSAKQRIEARWISKRAIVRAGSGAQIDDRGHRVTPELGDGLVRDPRDAVKMDDEIDLVDALVRDPARRPRLVYLRDQRRSAWCLEAFSGRAAGAHASPRPSETDSARPAGGGVGFCATARLATRRAISQRVIVGRRVFCCSRQCVAKRFLSLVHVFLVAVGIDEWQRGPAFMRAYLASMSK